MDSGRTGNIEVDFWGDVVSLVPNNHPESWLDGSVRAGISTEEERNVRNAVRQYHPSAFRRNME